MTLFPSSLLIVVATGLYAALSVSALQKDVAVGKGEELVTVKGCVVGSHFKPARDSLLDLPATVTQATEWILEGKKELLRRLRGDHDGHYEEVTGIIKVPELPDGTEARVRSKDFGGKTRVTIGQSESSGYIKASPQPIRIRVESFRHLEENCSPR
jgi:hypothetical protein